MRGLIFVGSLLFLCGISVSAFAQVTQPARFEILPAGTTPTTEIVEVKVKVYEYGGECPNAGPNPCLFRVISIHVTPCPTDSPCVSGAYDYTYVDFGQSILLTLERGQQYAFSGQVSTGLGLPGPGPCITTCTFLQPITALTYVGGQDPPAPTWEVTTDSVDGETVWVSVRMLNPFLGNLCARQHQCARQDAQGAITPLALDVRDALTSWDSGNTTYFQADVDVTVRLALHIGETYTLSGSHVTTGLDEELHGGCYEERCTYVQPATPKTIVANAVTTHPITWGAVKSMYRR